jgi:predicted dinucleotide-binding enzyme
MTTAIIDTGGIGPVIARQLASGGETLRLSSADNESARMLAAEIGRAAVVAPSRTWSTLAVGVLSVSPSVSLPSVVPRRLPWTL